LRAALKSEGLPDEEARRRVWMVNRGGVLHDGRTDLTPEQRVYAQPLSRIAAWPRGSADKIGLFEVIKNVRATVLIGLSTLTNAFTEPMVREMASKVARPIIFPLSNPTEKSEARPEDLLRWTEGRALVATGSPYAPVKIGGRTIPVSQCNNVYIFPAVGLAVIASRPFADAAGTRRITDGMMIAAARALAEQSPALKDASAALLPPLTDIRNVAVEIAYAVAVEAERSGAAAQFDTSSSTSLRERIIASQWFPAYPSYVPAV
jgi:malate dehydrogenase (oxaloacetate-decarboxylating)